MRIIKVFLASSAELDIDKEQIELFVSRKNKDLQKKRLYIELSTWKDFISSMTEEHSQEKYNLYIQSCDIAIFLFHTRLGRYTKIEFDTAHRAFLNSKRRFKKPLIYTYFKNDFEESDEIVAIKKHIDGLEHFYDTYRTIDDLFVSINRQLDKLENIGVIKGEVIDVPKIFKYGLYYFLLPLLVLFGAITGYYYYQPTSLTVKVTEKDGIPNLPFKEGEITLAYGDKTEKLQITSEVEFKQIPSKYKHATVKLSFRANGYESIDTLVNVAEYLELLIKRDSSLAVIFGTVKDENDRPLNDVSIQVKDIQTSTNKFGQFKIAIPLDKQQKEQRLSAYKDGFQLWDSEGTPSQTSEWKIILYK